MQQIGDSVFWNVENNIITENIATLGIIKVAMEIGDKQIRLKLNKIRSNYYEDILLKLGEHKALYFKKSDVKPFLTNNENKVFDDFLKRAKDLNFIESVGKQNSGEYVFSN